MASFTRGTSFVDGVTGDVTAAKLHALMDAATPVGGLVTDRTAKTSVIGTDVLLIADSADSNNLKKVTVANMANNLPTAVVTDGTVTNLTSAGAAITAGTVTTLTSSTLTSNLSGGTYSGVINATTGTFGGLANGSLNVTSGTVTTLTSSTLASNLTGGTYSGIINATTGTVTTLTSSTATISASLTARNAAIDVTTLATTSGTQGLDLSAHGYLTHAITGNITYTATNYANGRSVTVRITSDGTARNLAFPAGWVFVGAKPTSIAASKTGVLSLTSFGTTEANSVAAYAVQT